MAPLRPDADTAALAALAAHVAPALVGAGGGSYAGLKQTFREVAMRDPIDTLLVTVVSGAYLFYLAEKDENPKVRSYLDALVFVSTCLSVGYADTFARTPSGKAIAAFVMTFGPAVTVSAFAPREPTAPPAPASQEIQQAILARLDAILEALHATPSPPST
jgi:hypothetical protein